MTNHPLDNIPWAALTGPHAGFAAGAGAARRYAPGFSPIVAFADAANPDFAALAPLCAIDEPFYVVAWVGAVPAGWRLDVDATMFCMVWQGALPEADAAPEARRLGPEHAGQMMDLVALTRPGPFGPRTLEMGEYFGLFEGDGEGARLMAMAGERMCTGPYREVSGVCTHPDFQGRGLARRLMLKLVRRQMLRGETPFLHVMSGNTGARGLYERMGFANHRECAVRVMARQG